MSAHFEPVAELLRREVAAYYEARGEPIANAAAHMTLDTNSTLVEGRGQPLIDLSPEQHTAVTFTRELLQNRKVSKATYEAASSSFGQRGTMTLTNLVACYAVLAYNMNTFELEAPAHATEPPLPV